MPWLKANWFLLTAIVAMGVAWGEQKVTVKNLEQAVIEQTDLRKQLNEQGRKQATVEERTKLMLETQKVQQALLLEILRKVQ